MSIIKLPTARINKPSKGSLLDKLSEKNAERKNKKPTPEQLEAIEALKLQMNLQ